MRLAIFDDWRPGVVDPEAGTVADVSGALPWLHDPDPFGAGWWVRLCRDLPKLRARLERAAAAAPRLPLDGVTLRSPVLNPGKVLACASNYTDRPGGAGRWLLDFDVYLKAPSSVSGPHDTVILPPPEAGAAPAVHHEAELTLVIGTGGAHIPERWAMSHVLGYTIGLDLTVGGAGAPARSRSLDTFTPLGPWLTTADEVGDPHAIDIELRVGDELRQKVNTAALLTKVPAIVHLASTRMRLEPGDVIMTGAPPGMGPVADGDLLDVSMSGLGRMRLPVRAEGPSRGTR